jgi:endogenous inhibitor of DNA gyrase (YacG/DUF329 family)
MAKKVDKVQKVEIEEEDSDITCPVCGKPVGLTVASCPHCGAEFEEEEIVDEVEEVEVEEPEPTPQRAPVEEEELVVESVVGEQETAECPVCGKAVGLDVSTCPFCGAEFEEEEVEEIIEVVEEEVPQEAKEEAAREVEEIEVEADDIVTAPSGIMDLRVIGMALIALGVIGSQISLFIDWYWTWVPPIESNLGLFVALPAVVIVVGLVVFMLLKRSRTSATRARGSIALTALSIFLFGIIALVMVMLWNQINSTLQSSPMLVAVVFIVFIVVGVLSIFMGIRTRARAAA